ncbi:hypothetical protein [Sporobacter termitidis]|nr:hypothetical protein [Sporobacter termitidis]
MKDILSFSVPGSDAVHELQLGESLIRFAAFDLPYFREQCVGVYKRNDDFFGKAAHLKAYLQSCHPYCKALLNADFDKIVLDCVIDDICASEGAGLEELWVRNMTAQDRLGQALFRRITEYKTGVAINQWINLLRMQAYAVSKMTFVYGGAAADAGLHKARKLYYDLVFTSTAAALGFQPADLPKTEVGSVPFLPQSGTIMKAAVNAIVPVVRTLTKDVNAKNPLKGGECVRDQMAGLVLRAMSGLEPPADDDIEMIRRKYGAQPGIVYVPAGFKAILDLEFDQMLEKGFYIQLGGNTRVRMKYSAKRDSAPADEIPEPAPAEPEPAAVIPEPVPAAPEPAAIVPEPVPAEPEPAAVIPEPIPAEPAAAVIPEPIPAEPEAPAIVPEPALVEPKAAAASLMPVQEKPQMLTVVLEPDPAELELLAKIPEPAPKKPKTPAKAPEPVPEKKAPATGKAPPKKTAAPFDALPEFVPPAAPDKKPAALERTAQRDKKPLPKEKTARKDKKRPDIPLPTAVETPQNQKPSPIIKNSVAVMETGNTGKVRMIIGMAEDLERVPSKKRTLQEVNTRCNLIWTSMNVQTGWSITSEDASEWFRYLTRLRYGINTGELAPEALDKFLDATLEVYKLLPDNS